MNQIKNWKALLVITLLLMLLGGYYERLSVEIRTMILPMFIFLLQLLLSYALSSLSTKCVHSKLWHTV